MQQQQQQQQLLHNNSTLNKINMKSDHKKKVSEVAIKKNNASVTPIKAFKKVSDTFFIIRYSL